MRDQVGGAPDRGEHTSSGAYPAPGCGASVATRAHIPQAPSLMLETLRLAGERFTVDHMPTTENWCRRETRATGRWVTA